MKKTEVFYGVFSTKGHLTSLMLGHLPTTFPTILFTKEDAEEALRIMQERGEALFEGIIRRIEVSYDVETTGGSAGKTTYEIPTPKEKNYEN